MKPFVLVALLAAAGVLNGCAVLNTFQTPDTLEPAHVALGVGVGVRPEGSSSESRAVDRPDVPLAMPDLYLRVGLLPRVEVGARTTFFSGYGGDVKVQALRAPVKLSAVVGLGRGEMSFGGFGGYESGVSRTRYAALLVGRRAVYGGVKLTDYHYRHHTESDRDEDYGTTTTFDRIVPGLTVGLAGTRTKGKSFRPILELNTYFLPEPAVTINFGFQLRNKL